MVFDKKTWTDRVLIRLSGWKDRMEKVGSQLVYGFLGFSTVYPVLEAARTGDLSAVSTLTAMTMAAVGTTLIANQIQNWKDEADGARQMEKEAVENPGVRAELDAILKELEVIQAAEKALNEAERQWFAQTLHDELAKLRSTIKYEATIIGDGVIVEGGNSFGVAKGGVGIKGDATGNTIFIQNIDQQNLYPKENVPPKPPPDEPRKKYLQSLKENCQYLPLSKFGGSPSLEEEITLDKVYISLNTRTEIPLTDEEKKIYEKGERDNPIVRQLTALEAAQSNARMVLLGDAGAGKSTFARKLLAEQAKVGLGERKPLEGIPTDLLPVMVILRDLAVRLNENKLKLLPGDERNAVYIKAVESQVLEDLVSFYRVPNFKKGMQDALTSGKVLLVLDGLDEVRESMRIVVRELAWAVCLAFRQHYRILVTCRVRSYVGEAVFQDFPVFTLNELNDEQIDAFCRAWYSAQAHKLGDVPAKTNADDLISAIQRDHGIRKLASNPMLLTTIANIHQHKTRLPNQRVQLYKEAVELLLLDWQEAKGGKIMASYEKLFTKLQSDAGLLRRMMERLAYEAHCMGGSKDEEAANLPRGKILSILETSRYLGDTALADDFLDYVNQYAGLLAGGGGDLRHPTSYSFPHRTLQEYLAGCYLFAERPREVRDNLIKHFNEADKWSLAVEFGAEEVKYNGTSGRVKELLDIAYSLLPQVEMISTDDQHAGLLGTKIAALVGLREIEDDVPQGKIFLERARPAMLNLLSCRLPAIERAEAGRALAQLGDPRSGVMECDAMQFCWIPAGPFLMGSTEKAPDSFEDEYPQHPIVLDAYAISRNPVTQAQYEQFVASKGYMQESFWIEASKADYWDKGKFKGSIDQVARVRQLDFGEPFVLFNHPVTGITWYEALAFTRWLTKKWHDSNLIPGNWSLTLPSEAEWEKAARGGLEIPVKARSGTVAEIIAIAEENIPLQSNPLSDRQYPWGNEFDLDKANVEETDIGSTSAVGCFPGNTSPYGALDMSGNVWEWTRSLYKPYPYVGDDDRQTLEPDREYTVLRGGAFDNPHRLARCTIRYWNFPYFRFRYIGFRVVLSPCGFGL